MLYRPISSIFIALLILVVLSYAESGETMTGRYWYFVDNITILGENPELYLWVTRPVSRMGQDIVTGSIEPEPYAITHDEFGENEYIFWRVTDFEPGEKLVFYYDFILTPNTIETDIDVDLIEPYNTESPEYIYFTESEPWIEVTDDIEKKSEELAGQETNPYLKAKLIYDWVIANMTYEYPDVNNRGAAKSFVSLKGDCGEFSAVFAALCRAQGIPARTVTCVWFEEAGHQWTEILIPPYGWVPVDATTGHSLAGNNPAFNDPKRLEAFHKRIGLKSDEPDYLFGNLYSNRLIVSVGNDHKLVYPELNLEREFRFMQPGGEFAFPPALEWNELEDSIVYSGFYSFGDGCDDIELAELKAEPRMAIGYLQAGEYDKAINGFLLKLESRPNDPMALLSLGQAYQGKGDFQAAIDVFTELLEAKGGGIKIMLDTWAHNSLGECYLAIGEREKAKQEFQSVVDSDLDFNGSLGIARGYLEEMGEIAIEDDTGAH